MGLGFFRRIFAHLFPPTEKTEDLAQIDVLLRENDILNLPDAPDFISHPPEYTASEMVELCEQMLPYWNSIRYSKPEPEGPKEDFVLID